MTKDKGREGFSRRSMEEGGISSGPIDQPPAARYNILLRWDDALMQIKRWFSLVAP